MVRAYQKLRLSLESLDCSRVSIDLREFLSIFDRAESKLCNFYSRLAVRLSCRAETLPGRLNAH